MGDPSTHPLGTGPNDPGSDHDYSVERHRNRNPHLHSDDTNDTHMLEVSSWKQKKKN